MNQREPNPGQRFQNSREWLARPIRSDAVKQSERTLACNAELTWLVYVVDHPLISARKFYSARCARLLLFIYLSRPPTPRVEEHCGTSTRLEQDQHRRKPINVSLRIFIARVVLFSLGKLIFVTYMPDIRLTYQRFKKDKRDTYANERSLRSTKDDRYQSLFP